MSDSNFVYRFQIEGSDSNVKRFTDEVKESGGVLDIQHEERHDGRVSRTVEYSGPVKPESMKNDKAPGYQLTVELLGSSEQQ